MIVFQYFCVVVISSPLLYVTHLSNSAGSTGIMGDLWALKGLVEEGSLQVFDQYLSLVLIRCLFCFCFLTSLGSENRI